MSLATTYPPRAATTARKDPTAKARRAAHFLAAPPSEKIRLALGDLTAAERAPGYRIDMDTWHAPDQTGEACYVCLAGAVMAHRLAIGPRQVYVGPFDADSPAEFSAGKAWDDVFTALDELRQGYVDAFLSYEGSLTPDARRAFVAAHGADVPSDCFPDHIAYEDDPAGFKAWAHAIAAKLQAAGH